MSSESPRPAVQIQFDHLESELIFQPTDGETEGVPTADKNQKLIFYNLRYMVENWNLNYQYFLLD